MQNETLADKIAAYEKEIIVDISPSSFVGSF